MKSSASQKRQQIFKIEVVSKTNSANNNNKYEKYTFQNNGTIDKIKVNRNMKDQFEIITGKKIRTNKIINNKNSRTKKSIVYVRISDSVQNDGGILENNNMTTRTAQHTDITN